MPIHPLRRPSAAPAAVRSAQRLTFATSTLVVGSAIIQASSDRHNGMRAQLQTPAAGPQLPQTGAACWLRPITLDQTGQSINWYPARDHIDALVLERIQPSVNPGLIGYGWMCCNYSDPSNVLCTEGFGGGIEYPSADVRQVVGLRCSAAGTWVSSSGTGNVTTGGAWISGGFGGQQVNRNITVTATWHDGIPMAPQASNIVIIPAADAVVNTTQQRTAGNLVTWYQGPWAAWRFAAGTTGVVVDFDAMYWINQHPGYG